MKAIGSKATATNARIAMPGAKRLRLVNLNEEAQGEWREGDALRMEVGAKKIVTVEFEV